MPARRPPTPAPYRPLLTYEQAAEILTVTPRTVRKWATDGRLVRVVLSTNAVRVTSVSVDALIHARTQRTA